MGKLWHVFMICIRHKVTLQVNVRQLSKEWDKFVSLMVPTKTKGIMLG